MAVQGKFNSLLIKYLRHEGDTPEILEQKVFLLRNFMFPLIVIGIDLILVAILSNLQLVLLISPLFLHLFFMGILVLIFKRGIKWFFYIVYSGYIIISCLIILKMGGFSNSSGVWGGAIICYLLAIGVKNKPLLITNSIIYVGSILVIALSHRNLTLLPALTPRNNNLFFTINEIWMCLYLVNAFYDSLVKKMHESIRKAGYLQELNILKSRFYSGQADKMRTPLTLITLRAQEAAENHTGRVREYADSIIRNSKKILLLINQLQDLSNLEEGNSIPAYSQCRVPELIGYWVNSLQGLADAKKIKIHMEAADNGLMADVETEKLEKVFINILSNAIKYTPGGGRIYIGCKVKDSQLPPFSKNSGKELEISVRDTGIGIHASQLDKIFIRFYRINNNEQPYQEGSGIGLSLVSEYLKLMNGSVKVTSTPGKGSEFVIKLPYSREAPVRNPLKESTTESLIPQEEGIIQQTWKRSQTKMPELLIIDDNKEIINYLKIILESRFTVTSAENGSSGIKQSIKNIPDIIICDIMMPGKDGLKVCKEIKSDFRTNHIPIVVLSALESTATHIKVMESGADAFITKPFTKKELIACLTNLIMQRENLQVRYSAELHAQFRNEQEKGITDMFLIRLLELLEKNYSNDRYGIVEICREIGISRTQLHRKLIAITGQTASNFIRSFRLEKGRELLLKSDKTVQEIAYTIGFADANYFSKSFVAEYGITASELRTTFKTG